MRSWILRIGLLCYCFATIWICSYLYWTLSGDGVERGNWINQLNVFVVLISLVLVGVVVSVALGQYVIPRVLILYLLCALTIMTYAGTSLTVYDSAMNRQYSVFRGNLIVNRSTWLPAPPSRFEFVTDRHAWFDLSGLYINLWGVILALTVILFSPGLYRRVTQAWTNRQARDPVCTKCGYNLTGLTESRCPECGTGFS
jgi:hypothetical protein